MAGEASTKRSQLDAGHVTEVLREIGLAHQFIGAANQFDDITLLAVQRCG